MNLILLEPWEVPAHGRVELDGNRARHIRDVLRLRPGDRLRLGRVNGPTGTARVLALPAGGRVSLQCRWARRASPRPAVDLLLALPRPKVMKRLWAQLAALGVGRVWITNAERVERNYFDSHVLEEAGYAPLLREGLQQARATRLPEVAVHRRLKPLVEDECSAAEPGRVRLLADPAARTRLHEACARAGARRVLLAVGPEGGWTPYERRLFARAGFVPVGLGPRCLRTDTACVALVALAHDALAAARRPARARGTPR